MKPAGKNNENLAPDLSKQSEGIIVHAIRITTKFGIALSLFFSNNRFTLPLAVYLIISEILDQASLSLIKKKPETKKWVGLFYAVNSVAVISSVIYFAGWSLTDFYLVYLVHISSSTLAYGFRNGLISFFLSMITYSLLLFVNQASFVAYLRLPLVSVLVLRLLTSEINYEKMTQAFNSVLGVEKSKKDFIALASHNLRTPVAAIYGYIDLLLRGDAGSLNDEQSGYIGKIKTNNQELEKLTEQLLQISIFEIGKEVNLLRQPTQIELIIEDVVKNYEIVVKEKGVEISFQKAIGLLPMVYVDVEKIRSVIVNLIDNAVKYTDKGSIAVNARQEGDSIVVSIKDTGIGIEEEEIPKVFSKFYRSGNILVYNQTGVGLGLYLGRQIIELHGGKISVESTKGQGSIFSFTLPIVKEDILG